MQKIHIYCFFLIHILMAFLVLKKHLPTINKNLTISKTAISRKQEFLTTNLFN